MGDEPDLPSVRELLVLLWARLLRRSRRLAPAELVEYVPTVVGYRGLRAPWKRPPRASWLRRVWACARGVHTAYARRLSDQAALFGVQDPTERFTLRRTAREVEEIGGRADALDFLRTERHNRVEYPRQLEVWRRATETQHGLPPVRPIPLPLVGRAKRILR